MTILGDRAQTMEGTVRDVTRFLPKIFGKHIRKIEMKKSYRNTMEIAAYANQITGVTDVELFQRHGKEVEEEVLKTPAEAFEKVLEHLKLGEDQYETAAVIAMTEQEALDAYAFLKDRLPQVSYIDRDSSSFRRGLTVTTFYLAKGLEFDQVFGLCRKEKTPLLTQAEYICATRALHELYMYTV